MRHRLVFLLIWVLLLLSVSCSPQHKLQRITTRHPELISTLVKDTTYLDTVHLQAWRVDTMKVSNTHDTLIIRHDSTYTIITRSYDTLRVSTGSSHHTVVQPVRVQEKLKVIRQKYGIHWDKAIRWAALAIIAICLAIAGTRIVSKMNLKSMISG